MHIKSKDFSCPLIWHHRILLKQKNRLEKTMCLGFSRLLCELWTRLSLDGVGEKRPSLDWFVELCKSEEIQVGLALRRRRGGRPRHFSRHIIIAHRHHEICDSRRKHVFIPGECVRCFRSNTAHCCSARTRGGRRGADEDHLWEFAPQRLGVRLWACEGQRSLR